jgi:hypothetical protein
MALKYIENFSDWAIGDISTETTGNSGVGSIADGPRSGSKAAYFDQVSDDILVSIGGGLTTVRVAMRVNLDSLADYRCLFTLQEGARRHVGIGVNASGYLLAFRESFATIISTATVSPLSTGTWYHIEAQLVISDTVGAVEVRVNGNPSAALSITSADTRNGGSGTVDSIQYGSVNNTNGMIGYLTDLAVWDESGESPTGWIGDARVDTITVTGAGSSTQWTPSAGSNYECVDEANVDGDTSYIESSTTGQKDLFALSNLTHAPTTIHAVAVTAKARKTDAGSGQVKQTMKSGATEALCSSESLSETSYARKIYARGVDPATSAAWTISGVNGIEAGVESVI